MSKRDMQDIWSLLADLARELSWTLRVGFFGGLAVGFTLACYLVSQVAADEIRRGFLRVTIVFVLGLTALGGFLGLALGVVAELTAKALGGQRADPRKKRRPPK
jgi:hypothetical protein